MRNIFLLIPISILLLSCNQSKQKTSNSIKDNKSLNWQITEQSAGPFSLNEEISKHLDNFTISKTIEKQFTDGGSVEQPIYRVSKNNEKMLALYPVYNTETQSYINIIGEIMVLSPLFKTKEGVGIGTTIKHFVDIFPKYKLWYTYVSNRYVLENQQMSIQFLLKEQDFIGDLETVKSVKTKLNPKDFKENTQIYKIRIY